MSAPYFNLRDAYWLRYAHSPLPLPDFETWLAGFAGKPQVRKVATPQRRPAPAAPRAREVAA